MKFNLPFVTKKKHEERTKYLEEYYTNKLALAEKLRADTEKRIKEI